MHFRHLNTDEFTGEAARILTVAGYQEFKSHKDTARMFQKVIRNPTTDPAMPVPVEGCDLNDGKFFFTVEVNEWSYGSFDHEQSRSISVEVQGSKKDVNWKLEAWVYKVEGFQADLADLERRLALAWYAIVTL